MGGGGGGGSGNLGVILVRVCEPISQNLPHSYTWPSINQNVDLFIYCSLTFCTHFLLVITLISQSIHVIPSSLEKSLSEKYVHIPGCQKNGAFHTGIQKNRAIHILFVEKRGPIIYLAAQKKGAIQHTHPYYAINRKLPPPPPPHTHTPTEVCSKFSLVLYKLIAKPRLLCNAKYW